MSREIRTQSFYISEIIDIIYDELLTNNPEIRCIKIWVKFYDKDNDLISPYFYFKTKKYTSRYRLFNYLYSSFRNFKEKKIKNSEISLYVINIEIIF